MKKNVIAIVLAACVAVVSAGCSQESSAPAPAAAPEASSGPVLAEGLPPNVGVVTEALEGDGNSYVLMTNGDLNYWIAAPQIALNAGESIAISQPTEKLDYRSEALGRTFERIYFVDRIMPKTAMQAGEGQAADPHAGVDMSQGGMPKAAAPASVDFAGLEKLADGQSVGDLFAKQEELVGKEVAFRGKVVKFSRGIMGSNWAHVQDGTGEQGTNDITITTQDDANVGDTVIVRGMLQKDIDIGSGYFFPLILQDAKITVE